VEGFGGRNIIKGAISGTISGAAFGALATFSELRLLLGVIGIKSGTEGVIAAAQDGDYDLAAWRATMTVIAILSLKSKIFNKRLGKKGAGNVVNKIPQTRVGRWMSQAEYDTMIKTGKVPESFTGTTHVASPADINAFGKQAKPGSIYVEFDVPSSSLKATNQGWSKIVGPNSLEGRLAVKKGNPVPEMPSATNIEIKGSK